MARNNQQKRHSLFKKKVSRKKKAKQNLICSANWIVPHTKTRNQIEIADGKFFYRL